MTAAIDEGLSKLPQAEGELVALAGTATTVAAIHLGMTSYDGKKVDGLRIPTARLRDVILDQAVALSLSDASFRDSIHDVPM